MNTQDLTAARSRLGAPATASQAELLSWLNEKDRQTVLDGLTDDELRALEHDWKFWARTNQLPPTSEWFVWLILAGRGFGKTRTGVEWIRGQVEGDTPMIAPAGAPSRIALVATTSADGRDVMVEGESGLLACARPGYRPIYEPSKRRVSWKNGIVATIYSAEDPDQLRGPQHALAWGDEACKWSYPDDTWSNLMFGLRLGAKPQVCLTTTPRPIKLLKELLAAPGTVVTRGSTYDNSGNLPASFLQSIITKYEGTRIGRQELNAELLEDVPGALWQRSRIDGLRVKAAPRLKRIVVAIDPAVTSAEDSDEHGIICAGLGEDGHGYILADATVRGTPLEWARKAVATFHLFEADRVIAEVNNGGEMVEATIRQVQPDVPYKAVRASRGKKTRAEPIAALYEQGRVHHVGSFPDLEDQLCGYTLDGYDAGSPDRLDALVWAMTELMIGDDGSVTQKAMW